MITYESINEKDYDILSEIMKEAFNDDTHMHTKLQADGPSGYDDGSLIRKLNSKDKYITQKVCIKESIVGAYTISAHLTEYTLEMLFINPKIKSNGIGYEVWQHIENTYSEATKWFVETPEYSKRNYHFYVDKCGFKVEKVNTYKDGAKSILFSKEIGKHKEIHIMEIKGRKVLLKPLTRELCHEIRKEYIPDPMMTYETYDYSIEEADTYFDERISDSKRKVFAIIADGAAIGEVQVKYINNFIKKANLGIYLVNDSVKGKGYGTEAEQLVIKYAFEELNLNTLYADTVIRNTRSQYILQKLGFKYVWEDESFRYYELKRDNYIL